MVGIPDRNIRLLVADENYKAIPQLFEDAIRADLEKGLRPFLLVGNAGTTNTGAVDPFPDLAALARKFGLWFYMPRRARPLRRAFPVSAKIRRDQ